MGISEQLSGIGWFAASSMMVGKVCIDGDGVLRRDEECSWGKRIGDTQNRCSGRGVE